MYTKKIEYKQYLTKYKTWIKQELRTTNDAIWLHHNQLSLRSDVKDIIIMSIE